jgi:hypothetical protein
MKMNVCENANKAGRVAVHYVAFKLEQNLSSGFHAKIQDSRAQGADILVEYFSPDLELTFHGQVKSSSEFHINKDGSLSTPPSYQTGEVLPGFCLRKNSFYTFIGMDKQGNICEELSVNSEEVYKSVKYSDEHAKERTGGKGKARKYFILRNGQGDKMPSIIREQLIDKDLKRVCKQMETIVSEEREKLRRSNAEQQNA